MADSAYIGFDLAAMFVEFSCWFADFGRCLFGSVYAALPDILWALFSLAASRIRYDENRNKRALIYDVV